jgi:hypothetical protein
VSGDPRVVAVERALAEVHPCRDPIAHRNEARAAVAALDAYDRHADRRLPDVLIIDEPTTTKAQIEADLRERIAREIEARRDAVREYVGPALVPQDYAYDNGMTDAASIARGQS